jgi:hypothetical protein
MVPERWLLIRTLLREERIDEGLYRHRGTPSARLLTSTERF